jgi:hypothetical protein
VRVPTANPFEATNAEAAALAARSGRRPVSVVARPDRSDDTLVRCGAANGTCGGILAHIDRHVGPDGDLPTGLVRGYSDWPWASTACLTGPTAPAGAQPSG